MTNKEQATAKANTVYMSIQPRLVWDGPLALARQRQKQIPFGDDKQRTGKSNDKGKAGLYVDTT
jgi:hypothetical protein